MKWGKFIFHNPNYLGGVLKFFLKGQITGLLIASLVFSQQIAFASDLDPKCVKLLNEARGKILEIEDLDKLSEVTDIKNEMALALSKLNAENIIEDYYTQLEKIDDDVESLKQCGQAQLCLVTQAKKLALRAQTLRRVIFSSMRAESSTKALLKKEVEDLSDQMAGLLLEGPEYSKRITDAIDNKSKNSPSFVKQMALVYVNTFQPGALKNLFTRKEVRNDYLKNLGTTLFLQVVARTIFSQLPVIGQNTPMKNDVWILPNTAGMMALQSEAGGDTTPKIDRPFSTFDGALRSIPEFVHGQSGFSTDFKNKFTRLFSVIGLELPISLALRAANNAVLHVDGGLNVVSTAGFLGLFYGYLATRWAAVDKWTNINFIPNLHKGTELDFEGQLYNVLRAKQKIPLDQSFEDFQKNLIDEKPTLSLFSSLKEVKAYFAGKYGKYKSVLKKGSPDYNPEVARAYRKMYWAHFGEASWRIGNGLFDSIMLFALLHGATALSQMSQTEFLNFYHSFNH